jgi:hypothetical protein
MKRTEVNPNYFPSATGDWITRRYLIITEKWNILYFKSKYSDVGPACYIYNKNNEYITYSSSLVGVKIQKKVQLKISDFNKAKSISDLLNNHI